MNLNISRVRLRCGSLLSILNRKLIIISESTECSDNNLNGAILPCLVKILFNYRSILYF